MLCLEGPKLLYCAVQGSHKESTVKFSPELATQSSDGRAQEGEELKARRALSQTLPSGAHTQDVLSTIIKQLALCQTEELRSLKALTGVKKQLAVYRCADSFLLSASDAMSQTSAGWWMGALHCG